MDQVNLLEKIKEVSEKQRDKRPIGVDTLVLVSGIRAIDLLPLLSALADEGYIELRSSGTMSKRPYSSGSIALLY
jgi:hypothetical protein